MISFLGSYIYLNAANQLSGHRGELISKQFPGDTAKCLQFWYHMYGNGMGSFRVFITRGKKGRRWELFRKVGNRGSNWQYKGVNVKKHKRNRPFKVIMFSDLGGFNCIFERRSFAKTNTYRSLYHYHFLPVFATLERKT